MGRLQEACKRSPETNTRVQLVRKPGVSSLVPRGRRPQVLCEASCLPCTWWEASDHTGRTGMTLLARWPQFASKQGSQYLTAYVSPSTCCSPSGRAAPPPPQAPTHLDAPASPSPPPVSHRSATSVLWGTTGGPAGEVPSALGEA